MYNPTVVLLSAATATGAGSDFEPASRRRTFQASIAGTGAVTATVNIEVSNEADISVQNSRASATANWLVLGTITLSGTTTASDGFAATTAWRFVRANVTAISGTGTAATVTMGVEK